MSTNQIICHAWMTVEGSEFKNNKYRNRGWSGNSHGRKAKGRPSVGTARGPAQGKGTPCTVHTVLGKC